MLPRLMTLSLFLADSANEAAWGSHETPFFTHTHPWKAVVNWSLSELRGRKNTYETWKRARGSPETVSCSTAKRSESTRTRRLPLAARRRADPLPGRARSIIVSEKGTPFPARMRSISS